MFGKKPRTYKDIVRMQTCKMLMEKFPDITEKTLQDVYNCMVKLPAGKIIISGGILHFPETSGLEDVWLDGPRIGTLEIINGMLVDMNARTSGGGGSYDGGSSNNNNNNNNNNNG